MEQNALTAKKSHDIDLTDHQKMACQVISQALSITLSIRELIRQGYLFGAYVLLRSLVERSMILFYLIKKLLPPNSGVLIQSSVVAPPEGLF